LTGLALLIFAPFGIAQTSLACSLLTQKYGLWVGFFERLGNPPAERAGVYGCEVLAILVLIFICNLF